MRSYGQGQRGNFYWQRECERRVHAESASRWIRLRHELTAGRLHVRTPKRWARPKGTFGARTHCSRAEPEPRPRREGGLSALARRVEPPTFSPKADLAAAIATERPADRLGIPFPEECGSAPRE